MAFLRGIWVLCVVVVLTTVLGVPATLGSLLFRGTDIATRFARVWSNGILRALGVRPEYRGIEHLSSNLPCIFLCNHLSVVDIWVLMRVLPLSNRFVAKQSLFRIPVLGWAMSAAGMVPIDRAHRARAIRSLGVAAERIRAGRPVLLFPEGTRSRDGRLAPFKKGAFHLALKAGVPVVPIAIDGTFEVVVPRTLSVRPGPVTLTATPPIDVDPFRPSDTQGLADAVRARIAANLREFGHPGAEPTASRDTRDPENDRCTSSS